MCHIFSYSQLYYIVIPLFEFGSPPVAASLVLKGKVGKKHNNQPYFLLHTMSEGCMLPLFGTFSEMDGVLSLHEPEDMSVNMNRQVPDLNIPFLVIRELTELMMLFSPNFIFFLFSFLSQIYY